MDNRIRGAFLMCFFLLCTVAYIVLVEGTGRFHYFFSLPSIIIVFGAGSGIFLMRKHTYEENELGLRLKRDLTLAGWIGFLVVLIGLFAGIKTEAGQNLGPGFSAAIIPVIYGYVYGTILEAFFTKNVKLPIPIISEEEE